MSDFKKWFKSLNENGRVTYFLGQEGRISEEAWNHQQAIIDDLRSQLNNMEQCYIQVKKECGELQKELSTTKQVLHNVIDMERNKKEDLQKRVDEALRITSKNERYIPFSAIQALEEALRGADAP